MQRQVDFDEILEDSPMFSSKLKIETQKNKKLKSTLKNMNKIANQYIKAAESLSEIGKKLSASIVEYNKQIFDVTEKDGQDSINQVLSTFSNNFSGVNEARRLNFNFIKTNLIGPLKKFIDEELKQSKLQYKKLLKMKSERNSAFNKHLNTPPNSKNSSKTETAFLNAEESYVVGCLDLASKLVRIREKKKFEFVDRMKDFLQSQSDFYFFANSVLEKNTIAINKANDQLNEVKLYYQDLTNQQEEHKIKIYKMLLKKRQEKEKSRKTLDKSGYLRMKTGGVVKDWEKRFFRIQDNSIWYVKNSKDMTRRGEINLLLCTVKLNYELNKINCFQIVTPNLESSIILQAPNSEEMRSWMEVISNNIELLLNQQMSDKKTDLSGTEKAKKTLEIIYKIPGNDKCADCGESEPDWCAINLGVTFCIDCSGTHRNLGVQFSKVRSLTLDDFEDELIPLFEKLGNEKVNKILEAQTNETRKPSYRDDLICKSQWVTAKYKLKAFIGEKYDQETLNNNLHDSVRENDFDEIYRWLVCGANPIYKNPKLNGQTAYHLAVQFADPLILLLLIQFNSKIDILDFNNKSPLHLAVEKNRIEMVELLLQKNAKLVFINENNDNNVNKNKEENENKEEEVIEDPLTIAKNLGNEECIQLIEKYLNERNKSNDNNSISENNKIIEQNENDDDDSWVLPNSSSFENLQKENFDNNESKNKFQKTSVNYFIDNDNKNDINSENSSKIKNNETNSTSNVNSQQNASLKNDKLGQGGKSGKRGLHNISLSKIRFPRRKSSNSLNSKNNSTSSKSPFSPRKLSMKFKKKK
ncbi:centaurin/arf [Anaeramoeba flamelloides]|uniref:Centaurin/arf n=1 Tax=Anaeramoeba flamelloides TaxID=1746091 RepID=A0ABQ8YIL3_9EUKA|nr:centaurin/arf [Anaeramoeba flamelloides]